MTDEIDDQAQNQFLSLSDKVITPNALWNEWSNKRSDSQKSWAIYMNKRRDVNEGYQYQSQTEQLCVRVSQN